MKFPLLPSILSALGVASWAWLPVFDAAGQTTVTTTPVGYLQTSCLSGSDTLVAPPFTRAAAFIGAVSAISGSTVTFSSPGFTASQYNAPTTTPPTADTYYLSIGPATATLTGTLSVTSGSTTVTGSGTTFGTDVKVGDRLTINDGYNLLTYTVTAIASATSLTIDRAYADSAATGNAASVSTTSNVTTAKAATATVTAPKTTTAKTTTAAKTATASKAVTATLAPAATASATTLSGLTATFDHSPYEGRFYEVVSNDTGSVTVNLNGDTLASVAVGTQVSIIPYWTLDTVFNTLPANPTAGENVYFTPTTTTHSPQTQIFIPNYAPVGINQSATAVYMFYSNGSDVGWRSSTDLNTDQGYVPLAPDGYFTVRNPATAPSLPITFAGTVPVNKLVTTLDTSTSTYLDNAVALNRPANATLNTLGLSPSDGSFVATSTTHSPQDQLYVYDNTQAAINKSASETYMYYNNGTQVGWRYLSDPTTDRGTDPIPAGSALILRKAPTTSGQTSLWINTPNY